MENKALAVYSLIITLISVLIFWLIANKVVYSVEIKTFRILPLFVIAGLLSILLSFIMGKFTTKEKRSGKGILIFKGIGGGLIEGGAIGGLSGIIWGGLLTFVAKVSYWDSVGLIGILFLIYGGIVGLICGGLGYPIILIIRSENNKNRG